MKPKAPSSEPGPDVILKSLPCRYPCPSNSRSRTSRPTSRTTSTFSPIALPFCSESQYVDLSQHVFNPIPLEPVHIFTHFDVQSHLPPTNPTPARFRHPQQANLPAIFLQPDLNLPATNHQGARHVPQLPPGGLPLDLRVQAHPRAGHRHVLGQAGDDADQQGLQRVQRWRGLNQCQSVPVSECDDEYDDLGREERQGKVKARCDDGVYEDGRGRANGLAG